MEKATREQTKNHNTRLVLKTIYQQGDTSRADIARITNLTRTTVSDIVAELIDAGLLVETGMGESAGGKPPILLKVRENGRQLICLDLSTRPFNGAVVNLRGQIYERAEAGPSGAPLTGEQALQAVYELIDRLVEHARAPLIGIGVGVPGLTDAENGVVRNSVHLNWKDVPLGRLLAERYHLPVYLLNDSHAAALAEFTFGAMRGSANLILVRIGEGIGAGILLSGRLHFGDSFGAGEIGHLTVVEGGRACSCGNYGCLETVAAPLAIIRSARELAEYDPKTFGGLHGAEINWDFILQRFKIGDETITALIQEGGRYLGIAVANLVSILNVQRIAISGRTVEFDQTFLDAVHAEVRRRSLSIMSDEMQIVNSTLGPDIVILGVSAQILTNKMGLP
jgi:predicted NBD/HSP70 family sugar kinase